MDRILILRAGHERNTALSQIDPETYGGTHCAQQVPDSHMPDVLANNTESQSPDMTRPALAGLAKNTNQLEGEWSRK